MNVNDILSIIKEPGRSYHQRVLALAKAAENLPPPLALSDEAQWFAERGIIYDMAEGNAPYRPRYVVPDYEYFLRQGSHFLMLEPANDLRAAVENLLILYHHVPSTTGEPTFIGRMDELLEPYITDETEARRCIRDLLTHIDRTVSDSFCHCNLGPKDTRAGRIILELSAEMQRPVPNLSLLYAEDTPDEFALLAIRTGLAAAKPSFANHRAYVADWGEEYGIASCYNTLPLGGGGLTLGRLNLKRLSAAANSPEHLLETLLPRAIAAQCEQMDKRCRYIIDDCGFFEQSFLAQEGLIHPERFVGMFGIVGLAECVNTVLDLTAQEERFGHGNVAADFGAKLLDILDAEVRAYHSNYGKFYLHGQVGVSTDIGVTPNARIPVGEEPGFFEHLSLTARMQQPFSCGIGELFPFEATADNNPAAILDIIKGAFAQGMRYFSFYASDSDLIRVTGYLVKRSDIKRFEQRKAVLATSTFIGAGAVPGLRVLERKAR